MNNIVDIIEENKLLKAKNYELEERLKKYTCGRNHKKYYENNKEKIIERVKEYNKSNNYKPTVTNEKKKEYNKIAYQKRKEKIKADFNQN